MFPMAGQRASKVRALAARKRTLSLAKAISMGIEIWRIGRQEQKSDAFALQALGGFGVLMDERLSRMATSPFGRVGASWVSTEVSKATR